MGAPDASDPLEERIKDIEKELDEAPFYILVWGSGSSNKADYEKRMVIRDYLSEHFGKDKVLMSEDERFGRLADRKGLGVAEAIQAKAIDAAVVLDTSLGPHSEILKYGDVIRSKAIVFISREQDESESFYSQIAFATLKTERYTPEEYASCQKIRLRARDFLNGLRFLSVYNGPMKAVFGR